METEKIHYRNLLKKRWLNLYETKMHEKSIPWMLYNDVFQNWNILVYWPQTVLIPIFGAKDSFIPLIHIVWATVWKLLSIQLLPAFRGSTIPLTNETTENIWGCPYNISYA